MTASDDEPARAAAGAPGPAARRRRVRYRGTHPRSFAEKYKEHAPERYPELVEHVRQRGQTPAGQHVPILVDEVLEALGPRPGERGVDGTLGFGGHAAHLLRALAPGGQLLALDVDALELPKTEARLRAAGHDERALLVRHGSFAGLGAALGSAGWQDGVDFVFVDLGVSSMQLDDPARGFGVKGDGPLDMRMDTSRGVPASAWLARATWTTLTAALEQHADEPHAGPIARALLDRVRSPSGPPRTTRELAEAVRAARAVCADEAECSVRRVFQALRIAVNDELGALEALLAQLPGCLRPGGRAALLSFHSGEDRRVKAAFRRGLAEGAWTAIAERPIRASPSEQRDNPRSAPAKLRWARKA